MNIENEKTSDKLLSNKNIEKISLYPQIPRYTLQKDVVLSDKLDLQIQEALTKIEYHEVIYNEWNFKEVDPTGKGIILNFYGPSGTGKTLTAEAFAGSLDKKFLAVGIADLESKFMGETAKNIQYIFKIAKAHDAVLFFDEADTLLGKRLSSVTQGVDNEVNACRSTMLTELEKHEGIVIFATNFAENYDKAFEARISHHIAFELPDFQSRKAIWKKNLIETIPLEEELELFIDDLVNESEGLSGRDIRTCMRIALPKPLLECKNQKLEIASCKLKRLHLQESIEKVRKSHKEIGNLVNPSLKRDIEISKNLLGIKDKEEA